MFVDDLFNVPWQNIEKHDNVDDALELWNSLFFDVINCHLPMKNKRIVTWRQFCFVIKVLPCAICVDWKSTQLLNSTLA